MLRQRVLTALLLAPLLLWAVLTLPSPYLAWIFALIVLLGGREWARLSGISRPGGQLLYLLLLAGLLWIMAQLPGRADWLPWFLLAILAWWSLAVVRLRRFQPPGPLQGFRAAQAGEGLLVLSSTWLALLSLHQRADDGPLLLVFLLILIWSADIGAYFAGRRWGRVKLAPGVSPGKTWEGVYGALAGALVCGLFLAWWQAPGLLQALLLLLLCLLTAGVSIVGDLFESMLKRQRGVKDSSQLLPGHGGVLDRIDSLTAAAPLFLFGLMLTERLK